MSDEYKMLDVENNVKVAVNKLREAYWSNDTERYAQQFVEAKEIIISSICHLGYTVVKEEARPHGECKTCKHFVKGGLDGKTYVCEQPDIVLEDHFDYACIMMNENDFCSRYEPREKEGDPDDRA